MSGGKMTHGRNRGVIFILLTIWAFAANANQYPAVPGEYVVKLKSTTTVMSAGHLEKLLGATVKQTIARDLSLILVQRSLIETQASAVQSLKHNPMVEYAEPNYIYKMIGGAASLPNDPELNKLWGMINTGQKVGEPGSQVDGKVGMDIDMVRAWPIETGSKDVIVAVIDTGVNYNNADLKDNIYNNVLEINGKPNVDDDGNGYVDDLHGYNIQAKNGNPMDVVGHGTHCSGTIGAKANDNFGVAGVAWNVTILPVRFLGDDGSGTLADAITAIDYAIKMKANIMSNSWGGGPFTQSLYDVISKARDAGILFVAAAGNSSMDNDSNPAYPASYDLDNVISVAAIDAAGKLADFSNFGKASVHVAAPGVDVLSHTMKGLESWSGTSMACPHVSGIAALLLSQDMTQDYKTVKQRILASARPLGSLRGRVQKGLANAYHALTNTVAPVDMDDPFNWQKTTENISTPHPYEKNFSQTWTVKVPGAKQVAVYFSKLQTESGYDKVVFKDGTGKVLGNISGRLGETYSPVANGDTITFTFTADDSMNDYGFDVGGVAYKN